MIVRMSHPDPDGAPDLTPIQVGEIWENPATGERATILELPKGMPSPLQLALVGQEFSDVIVFRKPPVAVQRAIFGVLAPIARWRGYRATYPQLSRTVLAPRPRVGVRSLPG
jgi:hypothetical protein